MNEVKNNSVDLIITSPPYWNLKNYGASSEQIGESDYQTYLNDLNDVWLECFRAAKPGAVLVVNVNSRRLKGKFYPIAFDIVSKMPSWTFWDHNIWYVPNALPQPNAYMERLLDNKFESLLIFVKGDHSSFKMKKPRVPQKYLNVDPRSQKQNPNGRCIGNILRIPAYRPPNIKELGYHVAAYPEELAAFFIEAYTNEGDVVLDPFLGSGTTLKVARVMQRKGYGYEVHSDYRELIYTRISEPWAIPDWRDIDILHSSTATTGMKKPRKTQFRRKINDNRDFSELLDV